MGSPKHLWSGGWEEESAAARRQRPAVQASQPPATQPPPRPATPEPARATPAPRPPQPRSPRARQPRPRRRLPRISARTLRRAATVAALAFVAAFVVVGGARLLANAASSGSDHAAVSNGSRILTGSSTAWIGAQMRTDQGGGALIEGVTGGGPAATAGLAPGDVIIAVNGNQVASAQDVRQELARLSPGQVAAVQALRGSAGFTAQVTLAPRPKGQSEP